MDFQHSTNQEKIDTAIQHYGGSASTILTHISPQIFSVPEVEGLIGYKQESNCAVVIGDPVCPLDSLAKLTEAFHAFCHEKKLSIIYLLATNSFVRWAVNHGYPIFVEVGEELSLNPVHFKIKQKLRWKINQSIGHGVRITECQQYNPLLEIELKETIEEWLRKKNNPQIYLGDLSVSLQNQGKRIFFASLNGQIIGFVVLSKIKKGWVASHSLSILENPSGVSEHLMCSIIDTLAKENCHYLCLGAVSRSKIGEIFGINPFKKVAVRSIFNALRYLFQLDSRKIYLNKYHPDSCPSYLIFIHSIGIRELIALKKTLHVKL